MAMLTAAADRSDADIIKAKIKTHELNQQGYSDLILFMDMKRLLEK
jgi:hypothetical protein